MNYLAGVPEHDVLYDLNTGDVLDDQETVPTDHHNYGVVTDWQRGLTPQKTERHYVRRTGGNRGGLEERRRTLRVDPVRTDGIRLTAAKASRPAGRRSLLRDLDLCRDDEYKVSPRTYVPLPARSTVARLLRAQNGAFLLDAHSPLCGHADAIPDRRGGCPVATTPIARPRPRRLVADDRPGVWPGLGMRL
jgi:hypothetical protein